jgi:hypothetical protein
MSISLGVGVGLDEPSGSKVNLLSQPTAIGSGPGWNTVGLSAASGATAPDGTTNGSTLTADGSNGVHECYQTLAVITSGLTYTLSCYLKAGAVNYAQLAFITNTNNVSISVVADLQNGVVCENHTGSSGGTIVSSSVTAVGGGWYLVTLTGSVTDTTGYIILEPVTAASGNNYSSGGQVSYQANGTQSVLAWNARVTT